MPHIILPPQWQGRENDVTPETVYQNRRLFIRQLGLGAVGLATLTSCTDDVRGGNFTSDGPLDTIPPNAPRDGLPAVRNDEYAVPKEGITDRLKASGYNNFYEFDASTKEVWPLTDRYQPFPMTIEVKGLVEKKFEIEAGDLIREMELEERVYRFRCVEAWSMIVPWTGFPLRALVERCRPLSSATHIRFVSVNRPRQMPGIRSQPWYPWPYYEGLRIDEALNELAFVATGMYGEPLPKQNGSPLRLVLPWKYGYKGPKAIVEIEFTNRQPRTFWNDLQPGEYGFLSNVNPNIPHPRWSQATERLLNNDRRVPTHIFNGYNEWVAELYPDEPRDPQGPAAR